MKTIIFLGTPQMSADLLEKILTLKDIKVIGVVTQSDKPVGRKKVLTPSPVALLAEKHNIPVHKPEKLNKDYEFIKKLSPDLLLTFAYGQLISTDILALSKYQALNLHGSILPKYRGAAPIQYALLNGDNKSGITLQAMVKKMDAGEIYGTTEVEISPDDNYTSLCKKMTEAAFITLTKHIYDFFDNKIIPVPQDEEKISFSPSIKPEEEHLDLNKTKVEFINQIRALSETPGGYLLTSNDEKIKIYKAHVINDLVEGKVGEIIKAHKKELVLQLKDGQINLDILQKQGKNKMDVISFNNGNNIINEVLK